MSTNIKRRPNKFARVSKAVAFTSIKLFTDAVELLLIDFVFGKGKYRKRGPKTRPIIHRTVNRTVYVQRVMLPAEQGRVHIVKTRR